MIGGIERFFSTKPREDTFFVYLPSFMVSCWKEYTKFCTENLRFFYKIVLLPGVRQWQEVFKISHHLWNRGKQIYKIMLEKS